jgi:uncharacterized protein (DUF488 family)
MSSARCNLLTIGHSNHSPERFQQLVVAHRIEALVDVRSWPKSRFVEWADRSKLPKLLKPAGSGYLYLGHQLGGRPKDPCFYDENGYVLYGRVAGSKVFGLGIERLAHGIGKYRVAIMCSEEDPTDCHRRLLVAKVLLERGISVTHIRGDGRSEDEPGPIRFSEGSLLNDEEDRWRSSRSVLRKRQPSTSLVA